MALHTKAAGAVDHVVDVLGGAFVEIGNDEADVEAQGGCLDASEVRCSAFQDSAL